MLVITWSEGVSAAYLFTAACAVHACLIVWACFEAVEIDDSNSDASHASASKPQSKKANALNYTINAAYDPPTPHSQSNGASDFTPEFMYTARTAGGRGGGGASSAGDIHEFDNQLFTLESSSQGGGGMSRQGSRHNNAVSASAYSPYGHTATRGGQPVSFTNPQYDDVQPTSAYNPHYDPHYGAEHNAAPRVAPRALGVANPHYLRDDAPGPADNGTDGSHTSYSGSQGASAPGVDDDYVEVQDSDHHDSQIRDTRL